MAEESLVPTKSVEISTGEQVEVPVDLKANQTDNLILVAQMRSLLRRKLKKWADMDEDMTTLDLKNIVAAAKEIVEMGGGTFGDKKDPLVKEVKEAFARPRPAIDFNPPQGTAAPPESGHPATS